jgi:acyl transferase domain-containing protein
MSQVVFLYSGEGTKSDESHYTLLKTSPLWQKITDICRDTLNLELSLEELWHQEIGSNRCPYSPLFTVINGICLSDIWKSWGYRPDAVLGHSVGELVAVYEAGFYTLEEILGLSLEIGTIAEKLEGSMFHGTLSDQQRRKLEDLPVCLASVNFSYGHGKHVTLSCYEEDEAELLESFPHLIRMKSPHPWHHRDYQAYGRDLAAGLGVRKKQGDILFSSAVTGSIEETISADHWQRWLTSGIDFLSAASSLGNTIAGENIEIIEIGFHPVLERSCTAFKNPNYVSSMYRGEDAFEWVLFQRSKLDQTNFLARIDELISGYRTGLDYQTALAYQGFSSLNFVEFSLLLEPFFPGLKPQDFYRYKTVEQLLQLFGRGQASSTSISARDKRQQVVIAGMSCRMPGSAESPLQFWELLRSGQDQVKARVSRGDYQAGFLDDRASRFDHKFFNIADAEARVMDPQQILALELTELLWRDAGVDPTTLDRRRVGVYIGVWNEEYQGNRQSVYHPTGTNPSIIASRISYHYDLRGPSWVANTACSSSLLAVHYASKDIEAGRVDYAIAGGVNMILGNDFTKIMGNSGFLSVDSRCKTFDNSANGYVRAEGGGLVLLLRKELADKYYAELCGSSINQNGGRAQIISAPHPEAQEELILDACEDAGVSPGEIAYLECHGTGTKIGDPIEISALQNTVARNRQDDCYLGSVKSNIGHLESAAGIAGLLKSLLILNKGIIPANLHFNTPNQYIDFESHRLRVVDKELPLDPLSLIGVSSFGFGGANAHVIIRGVEETQRKTVQELTSPFDKERAAPITDYFTLDVSVRGAEQPVSSMTEAGESLDVRSLIGATFTELTGISDIEADIELTDQGLDSMSATQFISTLQEKLGIELDADLLFDYPLFDQLTAVLEEKTGRGTSSFAPLDKEELAGLVQRIFYELTNIADIDADIELTDQGLDSMSATQFVSQLSTELGIEVDSDILFDSPLYDQLVETLHKSLAASTS